MTDLPSKIKVLGIVYSVEYVDKPSDVDIHHRESLWGHVDYWTRSIRIYRNKLEENSVFYHLWHELVHALSEMLRIDTSKGRLTDDEKAVDLMALGISSILMENPEIAQWLISRRSNNGTENQDGEARPIPYPGV